MKINCLKFDNLVVLSDEDFEKLFQEYFKTNKEVYVDTKLLTQEEVVLLYRAGRGNA